MRLCETRKDRRPDGKVELSSVSSRMGRTTIELHDISKAYGDIVCVKDFTYIFLKNDRIGFVGKNGCGKSTLMKIIAGFIEPDSGEVGDRTDDKDRIFRSGSGYRA